MQQLPHPPGLLPPLEAEAAAGAELRDGPCPRATDQPTPAVPGILCKEITQVRTEAITNLNLL